MDAVQELNTASQSWKFNRAQEDVIAYFERDGGGIAADAGFAAGSVEAAVSKNAGQESRRARASPCARRDSAALLMRRRIRISSKSAVFEYSG